MTMQKYQARRIGRVGRERRLAMAKRGISIGAVGGLVVLGLISTLAGRARAASTGLPAQFMAPASDREAGYIVFPKVVVDTSGVLHSKHRVDTLIQLTNTDPNFAHVVHCFYVNATSHCSITGDPCVVQSDCNQFASFQTCNPSWNPEPDFDVSLSPGQAIGWSASNGGSASPATSLGHVHAFGGALLAVSEDVFFGELKCVEVDGTCVNASQCGALTANGGQGATSDTPVNSNDLKGEATIFELTSGPIASTDARSYNAIGFETVNSDVPDGPSYQQNDQVLCLGSTTNSSECANAEYASCPGALILNHWFDGARNDYTGRTVTTHLTLVPCTEDATSASSDPSTSKNVVTTVQLLVFNEFEQRFSGTTRLNCFKEIQLSDLDVKVGQEKFSIFNVGIEGTLVGQTRIRPVTGSETDRGHGIVGIAEEFNKYTETDGGTDGDAELSAAFNLNYTGSLCQPVIGGGCVPQGDFVRYSINP
jgi:hypothetical protein